MTFEKLSCKGLVEDFENKLKLRIDECTEKFRAPSLAVILVGENPASQTYVKKKKESCEKLGITHTQITFPEDISEDVLINKIEDLNQDIETKRKCHILLTESKEYIDNLLDIQEADNDE